MDTIGAEPSAVTIHRPVFRNVLAHSAKLAIAAAALCPAASNAASPTAPLVLQFPETMGASDRVGTGAGVLVALIGSWANAKLDEQSAVQVSAFGAGTQGLDFVGAVEKSMPCVGVPEPRTACRERLTLPETDDDKALAAELAAQGVSELVVVDVVPMFNDVRFRLRAFVSEMTVTPKGLRTARTFGAFYESRAPNDLVVAGDAERLREYWLGGEQPSRLAREALAGAEEIERELSFLSEKLEGNLMRPAFAKELPSIKPLEASGRVACRGMPCGQLRVVRDTESRLWLTGTNAFGAYGPVLASFDANAAAHEVSIFGLIFGL